MRTFFLLPALFMAGLALAQSPKQVVNRFGMAFVRIEPGAMTVGRFQPPVPKPPAPGEKTRLNWTPEEYRLAAEMAQRDARPGFPVRIERPYYIGVYEVTQAEWKQVMGTNPAYFQGERVGGNADRLPVESVSWDDTQRFIRKLNQLDPDHSYRLPTEFEWEYAARAGADDDISWADIRVTAQIDKRTPQPVGGLKPNAWGLYDTLGNVWEWVQDWYNDDLFAGPVPPRRGKEHVLKGASFVGDVKNATYLYHAAGPGDGWDVGFRLVMEPKSR